ncbi:hypothetical protein MNBD_IGNAVI01-1529, partial [hydrothermal vent metagenome]
KLTVYLYGFIFYVTNSISFSISADQFKPFKNYRCLRLNNEENMTVKISLIASLMLLSFIGCGSSELIVSDPAEKITVDGDHEDWNGKLKFFEDEKVALGFQNDQENLYFCLVTSDKQTAMKIMLHGLTIWFEPENGEQEIGLQYPKKMENISPRSLREMMGGKRGKNDFDITINSIMQHQGEFSLIDDDDEIIYSSAIGSNDGYEIKVRGRNQQFVYEAKIPIGNNGLAQFPMNIFPNEKIEIKFETGEIDMSEMMGSGGMGRESGMSGGGMRNGGMGRGRSGSGAMGMEKFSLDIELKLAK